MEIGIFSTDQIQLGMAGTGVLFVVIVFALDTSHNRLKRLVHPLVVIDLHSNLLIYQE